MLKITLIFIGTFLFAIILVVGVRLLILKRSATSYKKFWSEQNVQQGNEDELIYVALGDSAAQGIGASKPLNGYVGLVAQNLQQKIGKPVRIINLSVSGTKLENALKDQLPQLKKLPKPDLVTIEVGANDIPSFDAARYRANFEAMLNMLPDGTYVSNMPSFKLGRRTGLNHSVIEANVIIKELMATHPNLRDVQLYNETENQNVWDFAADFFHPSNRGYQNWARAFIKASNNTK